MKKNTKDNSIFYKIKLFFINIFRKNTVTLNPSPVEENNNYNEEENNQKNAFLESLKVITDTEMKLLQLQKQYRNREIKENDLTEDEINALCDLYDKQIDKLKKSNAIKKQKILEYKKRLQY